MVLNHVAQRAGMVVKGPATSFHADRFGHRDLNVLDVLPIKQRLEDGVAEAKGQEVLYGVLPEVMVDTVNLIRTQKSQDVPVQLHGALQVETERLFDHHASPRLIGLAIDHSCAGQAFNNAAEILGIGRQVRQPVAGQPRSRLQRLQSPGKALHAVAAGEVDLLVEHVVEQAVPVVVLRRHIVPECDHVMAHFFAKALVRFVRPAQAHNGKLLGQESAMPKSLDRRHELPSAQIAVGPENH